MPESASRPGNALARVDFPDPGVPRSSIVRIRSGILPELLGANTRVDLATETHRSLRNGGVVGAAPGRSGSPGRHTVSAPFHYRPTRLDCLRIGSWNSGS